MNFLRFILKNEKGAKLTWQNSDNEGKHGVIIFI